MENGNNPGLSIDRELTQEEIDRLADYHLKKLDKDYEKTKKADIVNVAVEETKTNEETNHIGYEKMDESDHEEKENEEEEWADFQESKVEEQQLPAPKSRLEDKPMEIEKIDKIKEVMSKVKIKPPPWAVNISDDAWQKCLGGLAKKQ